MARELRFSAITLIIIVNTNLNKNLKCFSLTESSSIPETSTSEARAKSVKSVKSVGGTNSVPTTNN